MYFSFFGTFRIEKGLFIKGFDSEFTTSSDFSSQEYLNNNNIEPNSILERTIIIYFVGFEEIILFVTFANVPLPSTLRFSYVCE